jgi:hypothetical protein
MEPDSLRFLTAFAFGQGPGAVSGWSAFVIVGVATLGLVGWFLCMQYRPKAREYRRRARVRGSIGGPITDRLLDRLVALSGPDNEGRKVLDAEIREAFRQAPDAFKSSLCDIAPDFNCSFELYAALCEADEPPSEILGTEFDRLLNLCGQGDAYASEALRAFALLDLAGTGALQDRILDRVLSGLRSTSRDERRFSAEFAFELVEPTRFELIRELELLKLKDSDEEVIARCEEALALVSTDSPSVSAP